MPDSITVTNDAASFHSTTIEKVTGRGDQASINSNVEPPSESQSVAARGSVDSSVPSINDDDIPMTDNRDEIATFKRRQAQMMTICTYLPSIVQLIRLQVS
jgi:hypothetical protein